MAKFTKSVDVWAEKTDLSKLQPGQWVFAGNPDDKGVFLGYRHTGSVVIAWHGNAKQRRAGGYRGYIRTLRNYALSA